MPFNGSGVFQRLRNWVADAAAGIKIRADYHDAEDDGFAAGLSNCITKDGQTVVTQNIPWNSKRITGLEDPVNAQDAATKAYADTKLSTSGGTINGDLDVVGKVSAFGYKTRRGLAGPYGANWFNIDYNIGTGMPELWIDDYDWGTIASQAYVNNAVSSVAGKVNRSGDTMTGSLITVASSNIDTPGYAGALQVVGTSTSAAMSFHRPGAFASNFGLGSDGNFWFGGWSHGGSTFRLWSTRDFVNVPSTGTVTNAQWVYAGDIAASTGPQSSPYEPYAGAAITGWQWAIVGTATVTAFRLRRLQIYTTSWFTIGYV